MRIVSDPSSEIRFPKPLFVNLKSIFLFGAGIILVGAGHRPGGGGVIKAGDGEPNGFD
jgi:hypothetical protein